CMQALEFPF
nr:immunoglobulin light chain junction region [Macaca mulatta]